MEIYDPVQSVMVAKFRLPGFDGAAITLRTLGMPTSWPDDSGVRLAFDVGLLSPDRKVEYLMRPADPGIIDRLAKFFWAAANEFHPEQSVSILSDETMGLTMAIVSSTDFRVEIQITLVEDMFANVREFATLNFETSRLALMTASREIRSLEGVRDFPADEGGLGL